MTTAISVENISKRYQIGARSPAHRMLREVVVDTLMSPVRSLAKGAALGRTEGFWALRDVSFDVKPSEVIGIVGRNGSGKSTLLKILSRITLPTEGRALVRGRVGSLLEVGTGFHNELTGRENTFLNGSHLGMSRTEIRRKFDAIVDFSGTEKFIDTPVKRYSSGMKVRLAFAVAAHLEPEILLIDEVLAVGDADFQKKCLGKMRDVVGSGRTILFVSHDMAAVQSLCPRSVLLHQGQVQLIGDTSDVISTYLASVSSQHERENSGASSLAQRADRLGNQHMRITEANVFPTNRGRFDAILAGDAVTFEIRYDNREQRHCNSLSVSISIREEGGRPITFLENEPLGFVQAAAVSHGVARCNIPKIPLSPGDYMVNVEIKDHKALLDAVDCATRFTVHRGDYFGCGKLPATRPGSVFVDQHWVLSDEDGSVAANRLYSDTQA